MPRDQIQRPRQVLAVPLVHARLKKQLAELPRIPARQIGVADRLVDHQLALVGALEDDGWVRRVRSEADRRVMFVELTHEGCQRFRDLLPRAVEMWEELQAGLSPEEQSLLSHLLAKLRMSMLSRYIGRDLLSYRIDARRRKASPMR